MLKLGMWPPGWMTQKQLEKQYEKCITGSNTTNGQNGDSKNTASITTTASKPNPPPISSQAHVASTFLFVKFLNFL